MKSRAFRITHLLLLLSGLQVPTIVGGEELVPVGSEFQVNSYVTDDQEKPRVAVGLDQFVVVWESYGSQGSDSSGLSVQGRRFASDGQPLGNDFQVNLDTSSTQFEAAVAVVPGDGFNVVWRNLSVVQGRRFAANGLGLGGELQVSTSSSGNFRASPVIASDASGRFVVVWESEPTEEDPSGSSVRGRRFAADGSPQGGEFQLNSYTTSSQQRPEVAMDAAGNFVAVWSSFGSYGTDRSNRSIQGRRFAADGTALGAEFQVNAYTTNDQTYPAIAAEPDGDFVVVWQSQGGAGGTDDSGSSIQGRRFAADGSPFGAEFQVNTHTPSYQGPPSVAVHPDGSFLVVWHSRGTMGPDTCASNIQGQLYDPGGDAVGGEIRISDLMTNYQGRPIVGSGPSGLFVTVWGTTGGTGEDVDGIGIVGRRFGLDMDGDGLADGFDAAAVASRSVEETRVVMPNLRLATAEIFSDGFESGDTSAWSQAVTPPLVFLKQPPTPDHLCGAGGIVGDASDTNSRFGGRAVAENFIVSSATRIREIRIWGVYAFDTPPRDDFTVRVHRANGCPMPSALLFSQSHVPAERIATGAEVFGLDVWEHRLTLSTAVNLGPGVYYIEIFNNSQGSGGFYVWGCGLPDGINGVAGTAERYMKNPETWFEVSSFTLAIEFVDPSSLAE